MVNTPPSERPPPPPPTSSSGPSGAFPRLVEDPTFDSYVVGYSNEPKPYYTDDYNLGGTPRSSDEYRRGSLLPAESAAAALAQLHNQTGWDSEQVHSFPCYTLDYAHHAFVQEMYSDAEGAYKERPRVNFDANIDQHIFPEAEFYDANSSRPRELLPSILSRSPSGRSSTLPPGLGPYKPNRPRKASVGQNARKPKHERQKSKDALKRLSYDRKALSAEPSGNAALWGKRWEDLIEAASSAKDEDSRDITPMPDHSPVGALPDPSDLLGLNRPQMQSPHLANAHRASLPPYLAQQIPSYNASPLQNEMTPPPPDANDISLFPSVESSIESAQSGQNFHMSTQGLSNSSPSFTQSVQIYCAGCNRLSILIKSYACTECICGLCQECVDVLMSEQARGRAPRCPRCYAVGGKFKPFQLDVR